MLRRLYSKSQSYRSDPARRLLLPIGFKSTQVKDRFTLHEYTKHRAEAFFFSSIIVKLSFSQIGRNFYRLIWCQQTGLYGRDRTQQIQDGFKSLWSRHGIFGNIFFIWKVIGSSGPLDTACSIAFLVSEDVHSQTLYCAISFLVTQSNLINNSFPSTLIRHNHRWTNFLLWISFLSTLVAYCMCNCAKDTVTMERLSANYIFIVYGPHSKSYVALCQDRSESSFARPAISKWYKERLVHTFNTFEGSSAIQTNAFSLPRFWNARWWKGTTICVKRARPVMWKETIKRDNRTIRFK